VSIPSSEIMLFFCVGALIEIIKSLSEVYGLEIRKLWRLKSTTFMAANRNIRSSFTEIVNMSQNIYSVRRLDLNSSQSAITTFDGIELFKSRQEFAGQSPPAEVFIETPSMDRESPEEIKYYPIGPKKYPPHSFARANAHGTSVTTALRTQEIE
jgi:hypothetical protein